MHRSDGPSSTESSLPPKGKHYGHILAVDLICMASMATHRWAGCFIEFLANLRMAGFSCNRSATLECEDAHHKAPLIARRAAAASGVATFQGVQALSREILAGCA